MKAVVVEALLDLRHLLLVDCYCAVHLAMTFAWNKQKVYGLRPRARKPARCDPLLTACHDALPPEILRHILLLRVAMPHNYHLVGPWHAAECRV